MIKQDELEEEEEDDETLESYQLQQLEKLQEINKKQQQYKFNNKESDKVHIQNICNHFDLSIQKLFHLQDKKQLETNQMQKLTEISLESDCNSEEENHFDDIEINLDESTIADKNQFKDKTQNKENAAKSVYDNSQIQKLNEEVQSCQQRENQALFERIKYENEANIVNEQDVKLIKSIINLENKQQIYQKYVQMKKKELQLQNLLNLKESSIKKQINNSVRPNTSYTPMHSANKQKQNPIQIDKLNQKTTQSFSNVKSQHELSVIDDLVRNNSQINLTKQKSYRLQNGKPVHENSVLSFLKSDYKILDSSPTKIPAQTLFNRKNISSQQSMKQYDPLNSRIGAVASKRMSLARLNQLAAPKFANQDFINEIDGKRKMEGNRTQYSSGGRYFVNKSYNNNELRNSNKLKESKERNTKSQQIDFYTMKKENKAEVDKMKLSFLNFFDECFEKKHEFEEEKQKLRIEISEWYCQNQQELTKLSNYSGPKLSTLSAEFKSFIEQKNFKKKLFNYLINSMESKDRQMAIYLYKQDRQLDDL